jgi:hypothetical protein
MLVKTFCDETLDGLDLEINSYIREFSSDDKIDIQFSVVPSDGLIYFSAMVIVS